MRLSRVLVGLLLVGLTAVAGWAWWNRERLQIEWVSFQIGAAADFDEAKPLLAWADQGDGPARGVLVERWGTGSPRFDLYVAQYVDRPESSEAFRRAFAEHLAARPELLERWAYYWRWRARPDPERAAASVLDHFDLRLKAEAVEPITWREVLNLQAVLTLGGEPGLARSLRSDAWAEPYRRFRDRRPRAVDCLRRPDRPFPKP